MTAREKIEFPPEYVRGPLSPGRARLRQVHFLSAIVAGVAVLTREAGMAGIDAPGLADIRQWAAWAIEENVDAIEAAAGVVQCEGEQCAAR